MHPSTLLKAEAFRGTKYLCTSQRGASLRSSSTSTPAPTLSVLPSLSACYAESDKRLTLFNESHMSMQRRKVEYLQLDFFGYWKHS